MRISYVIPALNERDGIRHTLARIPMEAHQNAGHDVEVIVVDGQSTDGTADIARSLGARVIVEPRRGYGRAYKTGLAEARGDIVVTGDADGSYPFEEAPRLVQLLEQRRYDFITVNRFADVQPGAMSGKHRLGNAILNVAALLLFGIRIRDTQSGMWVFRRRVPDALGVERFRDGMAFSEEFKIKAFRHRALRSLEVPGRYLPRHGDPKLSSWRDGWRNLRHLVRLRFQRFPRRNGAA